MRMLTVRTRVGMDHSCTASVRFARKRWATDQARWSPTCGIGLAKADDGQATRAILALAARPKEAVELLGIGT